MDKRDDGQHGSREISVLAFFVRMHEILKIFGILIHQQIYRLFAVVSEKLLD